MTQYWNLFGLNVTLITTHSSVSNVIKTALPSAASGSTLCAANIPQGYCVASVSLRFFYAAP